MTTRFRAGFNVLNKDGIVLASALGLAAPTVASHEASAESRGGKVLVVLSSAKEYQLRDGVRYKAGYYLDELAIPVRKMIDAGFTPVFANPKGDDPVFDPHSNNSILFNGDDAKRKEALDFVNGYYAIHHPKTLAAVAREGTSQYVGIYVPGGFSPMEDLMQDKTLGQILLSFHTTGRPTGLLCHGPAALLSTLSDPAAFRKAIVAGDYLGASKLSDGWAYKGYHMTADSQAEESKIEGPAQQMGGYLPLYVSDALAQAGAHVDRVGLWGVNVVEDREVVSGQQPFSSHALGDAFVAKLLRANPSR
ncbi:type 1 glutamine amidotransferase domain-containing protein [Pendulispora brunnea]|uniref:Type 1 glutamine amidotransferase domain-containing protein n=1 Tax=Pendulispora brunnea TaxID=2905690 RepID=A0ABZ2K1K4_9BACT